MREPKDWNEIIWDTIIIRDEFTGCNEKFSGWIIKEDQCHIHDPSCPAQECTFRQIPTTDYVALIAINMDMWEEFCEFHRLSQSPLASLCPT